MVRCARPYSELDDQILALYFRGMSVADIVDFAGHAYAGQLTPEAITRVLDAPVEEIAAWQRRRLAPMYPIVIFDALPVQLRVDGTVCDRSVHWAMAILPDGRRTLIGLWVERADRDFWIKTLSELRARGCHDILIAATADLEGMKDAFAAVFPATVAETCVIPLIRRSFIGVRTDEQTMLVRALRRLYGAIDTDAASAALEELEQNAQSAVLRRVYARWRDALPHLAAFFDLPSEVRQVIYTSDALERVHMDLRRIINMKARRYFSSHEAAMSLLWLAAVHTAAKWERSDVRWTAARDQLARLYGARLHAGAPSEI